MRIAIVVMMVMAVRLIVLMMVTMAQLVTEMKKK